MISVTEAEASIAQESHPLEIEKIPFLQAIGRILREPIAADRDLPPFDRVMMDGIVLSSKGWSSGLRRFNLSGKQLPGKMPLSLNSHKDCIKAMTGAVMPLGCDIVVPREEICEEGEGVIKVSDEFDAQSGKYLHRKGTDCGAGDELVLSGTKLGPNEIAVAASCGYQQLTVTRKIKVLIIDTGDELVEIGEPIEPHQIRRSNAHALVASCTSTPFVTATSRHCLDNKDALSQAFGEALEASDVVLLSGGVSKGDHDYVPTILSDHGIEKRFHWVNQWPGKPMWFGRDPRGPLVFGLPGNPLSAMTCFHRYVRDALRRLAGTEPSQPIKVILSQEATHLAPTTGFLPVTKHSSKGGMLKVAPHPPGNSGNVASVLGTDGFVQLPANRKKFPAGFETTFFRW